jgi:antitoxin component YwqK of YwqJK toxin-antitoxin module
MAREHYSAGKLEGEALAWYPDGILSQKENWSDDLLQDSAWYYHPNGKIHRKIYLMENRTFI